MSALAIVLRYFRARLLLNLLTGATVALGIALVIAATSIAGATKTSVMQTAGGFQLLVAAKGSPTQAVLNVLFFLDVPTGNVPLDVYRRLKQDRGVVRIVPMNMGDSYRGYYIVGTTPVYFTLLAEKIGSSVETDPPNRFFQKPFEAVVGATAARDLGLKVGDAFVGIHGFIEVPEELAEPHEAFQYTVVSILKKTNTPSDRAIFTSAETVWAIHDLAPPSDWEVQEAMPRLHGEKRQEAEQVTALLVKGEGYMDLLRLSGWVNRSPYAQAIFPGRVVAQLFEFLGLGETLVLALSWLAIVVAFIAIMISMLAATIERRREIATMRALGAGKAAIAKIVLLEAGLIAVLGAVVGAALGRGSAYVLAGMIERISGIHLDLLPIGSGDLLVVGSAVVLGIIAGAIPSYAAYRQDVAVHLSPAF